MSEAEKERVLAAVQSIYDLLAQTDPYRWVKMDDGNQLYVELQSPTFGELPDP